MKKVALYLILISITTQIFPRKKRTKFVYNNVPPTTKSLLQKENEKKERKNLRNIKNIVTNVVDKKLPKKKKRRKKRQTTKKKNQIDISHEIHQLLQEPYLDKQLNSIRLSLQLKKVKIKQAIQLISKLTKIKFIVDARTRGSIDEFNFNDLPLATILSVLLSNNYPRLALVKDHGIWRIMKKTAAIEMLTPQALAIKERNTELGIATIKHAKWDKEFKQRVEKLWKGIFGEHAHKNGNYLIFDDNNKKIFFHGHKNKTKNFKMILKEIDIKIPQVRIDARIILAEKNFEETIGIQWSGIYDRSASLKRRFDLAGVGIGDKIEGGGFQDLMNWSLNFLPETVKNGLPIKVPFVFGKKDLATRRLNLILNAAETKREIKTILKPSLLVNSGDDAHILVGENMPQDVRLQETIEGQPTNITTISYKDIGMKIKVKPIVTPDQKSIYLDIYVENSRVTQTDFNRTRVSPRAQSSFNYTIETSRSKNRLILRDGETTMISGLIKKMKGTNKTGLPILQEIPVLGWFFKGRQKIKTDKQILIFITPTLV